MTHFILNCVNKTITLYSPPLQNTFIPLPLCVIGSSNIIKGTTRASLVARGEESTCQKQETWI